MHYCLVIYVLLSYLFLSNVLYIVLYFLLYIYLYSYLCKVDKKLMEKGQAVFA